MGPANQIVYWSHKSHERCSWLNLGPSVPMEGIARRVRARDPLYQRHAQHRGRHSLAVRVWPQCQQDSWKFPHDKSQEQKPSETMLDDGLKNWCELDIDSDNLDSYTNKHDDWNLMLAHHEKEEEVYPLTLTEIADAQRKDQELKAYFKKSAIIPHKDMGI